MQLDQKAHRRFMESFENQGDEECWEWQGTTNNAGYPLFSYHGKMMSALNVLYHLYHKRRIPKNWGVTHTGDNIRCMNPNHVYITSRSELTANLYASGRMKGVSQKGAKNPQCQTDGRRCERNSLAQERRGHSDRAS